MTAKSVVAKETTAARCVPVAELTSSAEAALQSFVAHVLHLKSLTEPDAPGWLATSVAIAASVSALYAAQVRPSGVQPPEAVVSSKLWPCAAASKV